MQQDKKGTVCIWMNERVSVCNATIEEHKFAGCFLAHAINYSEVVKMGKVQIDETTCPEFLPGKTTIQNNLKRKRRKLAIFLFCCEMH